MKTERVIEAHLLPGDYLTTVEDADLTMIATTPYMDPTTNRRSGRQIVCVYTATLTEAGQALIAHPDKYQALKVVEAVKGLAVRGEASDLVTEAAKDTSRKREVLPA